MSVRHAVCLALAVAAVPVGSAAADDASGLKAFQAKEARLFEIGWKLVRGNAPYCSNTARAAGWLLHDAAAYGDPVAVRRDLGLRGDIGVQAVASGSPADRAGVRANDTLESVNEVMVEHFPVSEPTWQRLRDVRAAIATEFGLGQPVIIGWSRPDGGGNGADLMPVSVCATQFELEPGSKRAVAEGARVVIGERFAGFGYSDDLLAAAIAHELAHNLLEHRKWLDERGRGRSRIRVTEREADRLMPWLLANAGYDPAAAVRFMREWGPRHGGGLFRKRTHDGWDERAAFIEAELPKITAALAHGQADWSEAFERETSGD